jgi:hypothetical protein
MTTAVPIRHGLHRYNLAVLNNEPPGLENSG